MDLVQNPAAWILRQSSAKDPDRWTLQRSCNTDRVEHIQTWILPAKAAEDPRHRFFVSSLDLMCKENTDIDSCKESHAFCSGGCYDLLHFSPHTVWGACRRNCIIIIIESLSSLFIVIIILKIYHIKSPCLRMKGRQFVGNHFFSCQLFPAAVRYGKFGATPVRGKNLGWLIHWKTLQETMDKSIKILDVLSIFPSTNTWRIVMVSLLTKHSQQSSHN